MSIGRETVTLFFLGLLFAGLACILGYRVMWCVSRAGLPVKIFATVSDTVRMFRVYRQLAPSHGWPVWPVFGFWVLSGTAFALGMTAVLSLPPQAKRDAQTSAWPLVHISPVILVWIFLGGALQALWFTYRIFHKLPRTETGRRDWNQLVRDEYRRSDLYGAVLGWTGLALLYFVYAFFLKT